MTTIRQIISFIKSINHWRLRKFRSIREWVLLNWYFFKYLKKNQHDAKAEDIASCDSIALVMFRLGIGDTIVMSGLIHNLRKAGKKVYCICNKRTAFIYQSMIETDGIYIIPEKPNRRDIVNLNLSIDVMVFFQDPDNNTRFHIMMLTAIQYKHAVGYNQKDVRFFNLNIIRDEKGCHCSERMIDFAKRLGITIDNYEYSLTFQKECLDEVDSLLSKINNHQFLVFNPIASDKFRSLSPEVVKQTLLWLTNNCELTVIAYNIFDNDIIKDFPNVIFNPFKQIDRSIALLAKSSFLITVDTSFIHAGRLFRVPMIGIYNNRLANNKYDNNVLWGPNYKEATQVFSVDHLNTESGDDLRRLPFSELEKALMASNILNNKS